MSMPDPRRSEAARRANQHPLIVAYRADWATLGRPMPEGRLSAARRFIREVGGPAEWEKLGVDAQIALAAPLRHFALWLVVSGRATATADYVLRSGVALGQGAALAQPAVHARVVNAATGLGYSHATAVAMWSLLCRVAALNGVRVDAVTAAMITDTAHTLMEAERRLATGGRRLSDGGIGRRGYALTAVLFQMGQINETPRRTVRMQKHFPAAWDRVPEPMRATMRRFVNQVALTRRPPTAKSYDLSLRDFGCWIAEHHPEVTAIGHLRRHHMEAYKAWTVRDRVSFSNASKGDRLSAGSVRRRICDLATFFDRLIMTEDPDAPVARLLYRADLPVVDEPLPRFLDDAAAAKLMHHARSDTTSKVDRLVIELLARTGMRQGELAGLTIDSVVQIGSSYWLRVPLGKMHTDRYVPLHPELKKLLDDWIATSPVDGRTKLVFHSHGRRWPKGRIPKIVRDVAHRAGIGHVTPHQLRHTLATQAVNRGMSLEAIATLLGHKTMRMTLVYARVADRTVAEEYYAVTDKVEALYAGAGRPAVGPRLPAEAEGAEMRKLRTEMDRRMLGNGYCARPVGMDCHFEAVCEGCSFFVTTIEFKPTLQRQRDDAAAKGQLGRQRLYENLLARLDADAS